jgi:murein L,D-transpeptidase YcbB/YkuD
MPSKIFHYKIATLVLIATVLVGALSLRVSAGPFEDLGSYWSGTPSIEQSMAETLQANGRAVEKIVKDYEGIVLFYEARKFKPVWVSRSGVQDRGQTFANILKGSWSHGLNPYSYHYAQIETLMSQNDPQTLADLELLMTDAYIRLGQDLSGIRLSSSAVLGLNTQKSFWKQPFTVETLLKRLDKASDISDLIDDLAPKGQTYERLRKELVTIVKEENPVYESALPIRVDGFLHPYQRSAAVPNLRKRLGLPETSSDPLVYDDKVAATVIAFQKQNGLKADGIVGGQTLEILNRTRNEKVLQVIANLERLRWVEEEKPSKFVVVNIPSATLWAVENGRVAFDMQVIVGRSKRPTNMFIADITGVRFNPNWTVPPTIKKDDILPKLRADPNYLAQKGMQLIRSDAEGSYYVDPASVDWVNMREADLRQFKMVQTPGAHNPLGRVRVLMPNDYNIYLHDTNEPSKFNRAGRAESSGCVRMSEPEKMASFIMKDRPGWSDSDMEALFVDGRTKDVSIPQSIPVYMLYYTVWISEEGRVVYGNDLYGYDNKLIKMLKNIDGIFIPGDDNRMRSG